MNSILAFLQNLQNLSNTGQFPEWGLWSYIVLAVVVAVEGPIATLLGAAAASAGVMRPIPVFLAASLGNLAADSIWYGLGYLGNTKWVFSLGRRFGVDPAHMELLEKSMQKHASKVIFFAKLSMSLVIPTLIAAGLVKVPWRKWFPFVFTAEMFWTGSLVLIGYHAAETLQRVEEGMEIIIVVGTAVFIGFLFFLGRRVIKSAEREASQTK